MADLNKVLIMGRMTRDPQVRQTPSGQSVGELSMAINRAQAVLFIHKAQTEGVFFHV